MFNAWMNPVISELLDKVNFINNIWGIIYEDPYIVPVGYMNERPLCNAHIMMKKLLDEGAIKYTTSKMHGYDYLTKTMPPVYKEVHFS